MTHIALMLCEVGRDFLRLFGSTFLKARARARVSPRAVGRERCLLSYGTVLDYTDVYQCVCWLKIHAVMVAHKLAIGTPNHYKVLYTRIEQVQCPRRS